MRSISPAQVHEASDPYILDVREAEEVAQARLEGAHHIPLGELGARFDEVPRDRTVYVLCKVGGRSAQATVALERARVDAINIDGGIVAWYQAGLPVTLGED